MRQAFRDPPAPVVLLPVAQAMHRLQTRTDRFASVLSCRIPAQMFAKVHGQRVTQHIFDREGDFVNFVLYAAAS